MSKIAIIAGQGILPEIIFEYIPEAKIIAVEGNEPKNLKADITLNFGEIGKLLGFLRTNEIEKICFAGSTKKPDLKNLKLDKEGSKLLAKIMMGKMFSSKLPGDDALLSKILRYFEKQGFAIVGAHEICPKLLAKKGVLNNVKFTEQTQKDIDVGITAAKDLGKRDEGQAVIVKDSKCALEEDVKGTENLIERAKGLKNSVLVKCAKPQQDMRIDLPSIGVETIEQMHKAGVIAVAVEAGASLILDKDKVINKADDYNILVIGI